MTLHAFFSYYYTASTTGPSYLLCLAMRANLVVKFFRVSPGKLSMDINRRCLRLRRSSLLNSLLNAIPPCILDNTLSMFKLCEVYMK